MSGTITELCDSLVYNYLIENGHNKSAEILLEERKNCASEIASKENLKIQKIISKTFECLKLHKVSNTIVYRYLAQELAKELKICLDKNIPSTRMHSHRMMGLFELVEMDTSDERARRQSVRACSHKSR